MAASVLLIIKLPIKYWTSTDLFLIYFFFKLGFTPCKAEQPLRAMELQEKKHKISTMSQGFKRTSKSRTNNPAHPFLYLL